MSGDKEKFYSQNGEDMVLQKIFGGTSRGFFVDVGAFDGKHLSNTYFFERAGWEGVCFEPHPFYFEKCRENRPKSQCIHAAITGDEKVREIELYEEELGLLSSLERRDEEDIKFRYSKRGLEFKGLKKTRVPATTLNRYLGSLERPPQIDFVSIDVEGHELEVLRGFSIGAYRPRVLVVEANAKEQEEKLDKVLVGEHGYIHARRLVENIFYCRDREDAEAAKNCDVGRYMSRRDHPLGGKYNPPRLRRTLVSLWMTIKRTLGGN